MLSAGAEGGSHPKAGLLTSRDQPGCCCCCCCCPRGPLSSLTPVGPIDVARVAAVWLVWPLGGVGVQRRRRLRTPLPERRLALMSESIILLLVSAMVVSMKNCLEPTGLRRSSFAAVLAVRLRELITQQLSAQGVRNTRAIGDIIVSENDCIVNRLWEGCGEMLRV